MTSFGGKFGTERGLVFRPPATANLMIDSADRGNQFTTTPFDFQITRNQALLNGFFTRVATTEVVLEWCEPNIKGTLILDVSGASSRQNVSLIFVGNYTMENLMDAVVQTYNSFSQGAGANQRPTGTTLSVSKLDGYWGFDLSGGQFQVLNSPLAIQMGLEISSGLDVRQPFNNCVDLRLYRYIDFVSNQLTYCQDLKDNTTQAVNRDILVRWYFADDGPTQLDQYGFPVLQGYTAFNQRRLFNPPKYIKWDPIQPLGNLQFKVYTPAGDIVPQTVPDTQWLMTLQLSEN